MSALPMPTPDSGSWIDLCGAPSQALQDRCQERVSQHLQKGDYSVSSIAAIAALRPAMLDRSLVIGEKDYEALRRLCQVWDVDLRPSPITSHRPLVGPLIVAMKKLLFPVLRVFLKDTLRQQRDFNSQTLVLLTQLCNRISSSSQETFPDTSR